MNKYIIWIILAAVLVAGIYFVFFRKEKPKPTTTTPTTGTGTGTGTGTTGTTGTAPGVSNSTIADELIKSTRFPASIESALYWLDFVNSANYAAVNSLYLSYDLLPPTPESLKSDLLDVFGNDPRLTEKISTF